MLFVLLFYNQKIVSFTRHYSYIERYLQAEHKMTKISAKIITLILGFIAVYFTIKLIPDGTTKRLTSLSKEYQFENEITISEKFTTDFTSSYGIHLDLLNSNHSGFTDTILPLKIDLDVLKNNKPVELFGDYKDGFLMVNGNAQLTSFLSKEGNKYEIKLNLKDDNSNQKKVKLNIETNVPGPSYDLLIEREFKWVFWIIDGILILIALITGYFGFRKKEKPAANTVYKT